MAEDSRNLSISKVGSGEPERTGTLVILGAHPTAHVMSGGAIAADHLPGTVKLPPGDYEIRTVDKGQVVSSQSVHLEAFKTVSVTIEDKK